MTPTKRDVEKAREIAKPYSSPGSFGQPCRDLVDEIAIALAEERERAASIAETWPHPCGTHDQFRIANKIRGQADEA